MGKRQIGYGFSNDPFRILVSAGSAIKDSTVLNPQSRCREQVVEIVRVFVVFVFGNYEQPASGSNPTEDAFDLLR